MREVCNHFQLDNGTRLYYCLTRRDDGHRPLLLLLHGLASNLTRWSEFVEHTVLDREWDILRLDLRGHGRSPYRGHLGYEHWSRDLVALLAHLGYRKAVVAGHSLGANLALWFACLHPEHVRALVLIDPVIRATLRGRMRTLARLAPLIRTLAAFVLLLNRLGVRRRHIPGRDLRRLDEQVRRTMLDTGYDKAFVRRYTSPLADLRHFPTANFLGELAEITRPLPPLAAIAVPVLALLSAGAAYTDPAATRAQLGLLPALSITDIDAYHWPLTERPVEVRRAVERYCDGLVAGTGPTPHRSPGAQ